MLNAAAEAYCLAAMRIIDVIVQCLLNDGKALSLIMLIQSIEFGNIIFTAFACKSAKVNTLICDTIIVEWAEQSLV